MRFKEPDPSPAAGSAWLLVDLALALHVALGTFGALWVSDDFDAARFELLAFVGAPLAIGHVAVRTLFPDWIARRPAIYARLVVAVALSFVPGTAGLVNAVTTDGRVLKRTIEQGTQVVTRDVHRGGLGVLFRTRW